ncbi:hypothetical protein [Pseudoteredinibacter isoporae]|uniref:Secreted protein n=1 Tax=Pseudoteredinibacter isoporae TaxID=570281 RepID=A0A7X0JU31_9GAMM|nr:hypothetical protein [Pseudoteredinibacter isoporae]MBB6521346.1 hypothetical protein [Pseudoteredinibacter isoporae]NHO86901.1 hypothetical protein [Pseudoteredinibacter isoporae]NIB24647.1 hypothetical protein [Pseudoteredinibacter isoporae]
MKTITKYGISCLTIATLSLSASINTYAADEKDSAKDDDRRVCKKYRPTGTRIAKKTCMTKRQWAELKRRAQDAARTGQRLGGHQNMENPLHPGSGRN